MPIATAGRSPRRLMTRTIAFGLSALCAAVLLTWAPAAASGWNQGSAEATLWQLLNGARTNNGLAPLQQHGTLVSLARWRSSDMLSRNYFSHTIPGCGCLVYTYYDSNGVAYDWAGENIAWNSGHDDAYSPVAAHEGFMSSPGHRANVLYPAFTHGGVGAAARDSFNYLGYGVMNVRMYTELFLEPPNAAPAPPPGGGGGGGGGSGGGGGGGGGTTTVRPAPAATPEPEPEPKEVAVAAPRRPVSGVGIDGVATPVEGPAVAHATAFVAPLAIDQLGTAASVAAGTKPPPAALARAPLEVSAPEPVQAGVLDGILGAILGFLFG
jgi:uncharacterized protein YkwD